MRSRAAWALTTGVALTLLLPYSNSFNNGFHYDDAHSVVENPHVRSLANAASFFTSPEMFSNMPERAMYRPLVVTSYALNYWLDEYDVFGYHVVNFVLHLACAACVVQIGRMLALPVRVAATAGLLFGLHPLQSETVNYISSRSESLATLAYLGSFLCYLRWRACTGSPLAYLGSLALFAAALASKVTAVTLPIALMICDSLGRPLLRGTGVGQRGISLRHRVPFWLLAGAYLLIVKGFAAAAIGEPVRPLVHQFYTQMKAVSYYVFLVAMPVSLNVEHQFAEARGLGASAVIGSLLLALSLAWLVSEGASRGGRQATVVCLFLCLAAVSAVPAAALPLNVHVNEHRLYFPMAFLCLPVAMLWWSGHASPRLPWRLGSATLAIMAALVFQRNPVWLDELSLWRDSVARSPAMYRAHMHLGGALEDTGDLAAAVASYGRSVELAPDALEAHYNYANALRGVGDSAGARKSYAASLRLNPAYVPALVNLSSLEKDLGQPLVAEKYLATAIELMPHSADMHRRMGLVYKDQGRLVEAESAIRRAIELDGEAPEAHYNLGNLYFDSGRLSESVQVRISVKITTGSGLKLPRIRSAATLVV